MLGNMKIYISNVIIIENPTKEVKDFCMKNLTFKNPEYQKKLKMGFYAYGTPKEIKLYDIVDNKIYVPTGFFNDLWSIHPVLEDYIDYSVSVPIDVESKISLRDYQKPAVKAVKEKLCGIISMGCGMGKTCTAIEAISEIKQKTLWIAGTIDLINQAKETAENLTSLKVSLITDGKCDTSGDMVCGTPQSIIKFIDNGVLTSDMFGCVVHDECFPAGTKISTKNGYKNIEDIRKGDYVYSYNHKEDKVELKKVDYLFSKDVDNLLTIELSNGTIFSCTENHPIYCNDKYIRADELKVGDELYDMQFLWKRNKERRLHKRWLGLQNEALQKNRNSLLFPRMWFRSKCDETCETKQVRRMATKNERTKPDVQSGNKGKSNEFITSKGRLETESTWWKRNGDDKTTRDFIQRVEKNSGSNSRVTHKNLSESWQWLSTSIQGRFRNTFYKISNRGGWSNTSRSTSKSNRQEKRQSFNRVRVESITIQKRDDTRKSITSNGRIKVYNIGVEDNHNYFVNDILVHNCHHLSANPKSMQMFRKCVEHFASRYRIGLTATCWRSDGLEGCILKIMGGIIYNVEQYKDKYRCIYNNEVLLEIPVNAFQVPAVIKVIETGYNIIDKQVYDKNGGTLQFATLISDIAENKERNDIIIKTLKGVEGSTIVLSDRTSQLEYLASKVDNSIIVTGSTPKKIREKSLNDMRAGKIKYLFSTYQLAKEGLDIPILQNLVMATPVKTFSTVKQSVGRIQRLYGDKQTAYVYDFMDDVGMLFNFFNKRRSIYRKNNWQIENVYLSEGK